MHVARFAPRASYVAGRVSRASAPRGIAIALFACALATGCDRSRTEVRPAPDVLLVTIDTLRPDHLSAYGYARRTSPNLDRLAADGALFEVAYAPVPATTPSHATLLTALYPFTHGVLRNGVALRADVPTLPALLGDAGYLTAAFVSSFPVSSEFGLARGFAHFDERFDGVDLHPPARRGANGEGSPFARLGEHTIDATLAWLAAAPEASPRFVWVHLFDPHAPYRAPAPYNAAFRSDHSGRASRRIDAYDGEILYADAQLGRLVDSMRAAGRERRLLTIVTADHGEAFNEHGWLGHNHSVFEEEVRIPLVVNWPGVIAPGQRLAETVHLVDIVPTILSATGLGSASSRFDGIDLLPAMTTGDHLDKHRAVFLQRPFFEKQRRAQRLGLIGFEIGARQGRWKYVEALEEGRTSLFDLIDDPGERQDLASRESGRDSELGAVVSAWRSGTEVGASTEASPSNSGDVRRKLRALGYTE